MEPVVTLEGAHKISGTVEPQAMGQGAGDVRKDDGVAVPLDGQSVLFTNLDRETLLIAGIGEAFAGGLPAVLNEDPKTSVPCTIAMLSPKKGATAKKTPFVAVLSLRQVRLDRLDRVTIKSQGHAYPYALKQAPVDFAVFLGLVSDVVRQSEAEIVDGLVEALLFGNAAAQNTQIAAKIVAKIARQDGVIEAIGSFDEGDTYLQGWAKGLPAGNCRVFVSGDGLTVAEMTCSLFERKETGGKAVGFAGLLEPEEALNAQSVRGVFFRGRTGWHTVEVHEKRSLLDAPALPGQVRALLPKLSGAGDGKRKLLRVSQRFDGRETVSELDLPVRVGVDFGTLVDQGGVILSGWLLNPEDWVEAVYFRSAGGSFRIDDSWTSQERPDVSGVFETLSPFLSGPSARHRHGFLALLRGDAELGSGQCYLEIVLTNGQSAYAPIALGRAPLKTAVRRLAATLNPAAALNPNVVERQFVPMFCDAMRAGPAVSEVLDLGPVPEKARAAVVIGLDDAIEQALVLLPLFALDPFLRGTPLVLAGPAAALGEQLEEIKRLAGFYGLAVRVVLADHVEDRLDAIEAGIGAAPSDTVVSLCSGLLPRESGWLESLISAFQSRKENCLVAPTILYEDETIRWAGTWLEQENGDAVLRQHYLGYPRRTLLGADISEVTAATFDCCVLPRAALEAAGGFSRRYLGTDEKGIDAAMKLRERGLPSIWVPHVEMIHPEDSVGGERNWQKLVTLIDRKIFDRTWAEAMPGLIGADL